MGDAFHWIGVAVVYGAIAIACALVLLWLYANVIHGRVETILFRKPQRRLSLASWHATKLLSRDREERDDDWPADDWPVNPRPLYLSYRLGDRRLFLMAGLLDEHRSSSIKGTHPAPWTTPSDNGERHD